MPNWSGFQLATKTQSRVCAFYLIKCFILLQNKIALERKLLQNSGQFAPPETTRNALMQVKLGAFFAPQRHSSSDSILSKTL